VPRNDYSKQRVIDRFVPVTDGDTDHVLSVIPKALKRLKKWKNY